MFRLKEEKNLHIPARVAWWVLTICLIGLWAGRAGAVGTSAGTTITSTATVNFTLGGDPSILTTQASSQFDVLEIIDASLVWQDITNVAVNTPNVDRVLTFLLTNTGNGPENFQLTADETLPTDEFDPGVQSIWIESNGTPGRQADDTPYSPAGLPLTADSSAIVYVSSTIPAGLTDSDTGMVRLTATAMTGGAGSQAPGTLLPGAGLNTVDAVVGLSGAQGDATGTYEVAAVSVAVSKSIAGIIDPFGGDRPYTGARVTYRLTVDIAGSGTAEALVVTDPIPGDMTYVAGSILLNGAVQTDAADGDLSDFNMTAAGTVTVNLNDTVAPATHIIEFSTTIN